MKNAQEAKNDNKKMAYSIFWYFMIKSDDQICARRPDNDIVNEKETIGGFAVPAEYREAKILSNT